MAVIKQYHKDTDTTYAYESISYWDAEKQQSRSKRKLLGKVDPETGEIIPTGRKGRKKADSSADETATKGVQLSDKYKQLYEDALTRIKELTIRNKGLQSENRALAGKNLKLSSVIKKLETVIASAKDITE